MEQLFIIIYDFLITYANPYFKKNKISSMANYIHENIII